MQQRRIAGLPDAALAAAAAFHADWLPGLRADASTEDLALIFPPADHTHRGWRLAAVQGLALELAPRRVNALAADGEAAIVAALAYLAGAEGLTGQYLPLDDAGGGAVIGSAA